MSQIFLKIVNMSIAAGWLVLAVLLLRLILKKAPKWVNVLLWAMVAVRLICPFSFESVWSLIPSAETISPEIMLDPTPEISTGILSLNNVINPVISESFSPAPLASANPLQILIPVAANLWLLGVLVMLAYTAVSYGLLRRKVRTAVLLKENIFQSEYVASPFVLGIIKPKIYLPFQMDEQNQAYVIAHEQSHIRRKDHWWKPVGFLLLAVYWFNPLMWLAYIFLCRDIELACDEKVIRELDGEHRADYTQALLVCSVSRRSIAACPLAFGEVGVKERVKSVMHYKKPTFWIILLAVAACIVSGICFLTDPTPDYGIGIRSIETGVDDEGTPAIILDYLFLVDGEKHFYGDWITTLSPEDGEYTENGLVEYSGDLGQYRIAIKFKRTKAGAGFQKTHTPGQVYTLEKPTENFWTDLKYKVVYPPDYSMVIYIGSDKPIGHKNPALYNVRYLGGKMYIRLYGVAENTGTELVVVSGENIVPLMEIPADTPIAEYARAIHWLTIKAEEKATVPFEIRENGEPALAFYEIYDAETLEPLEYFQPSGLEPQTYLFQNADPDRLYIVQARLAQREEIYAFGAAFPGNSEPVATIQGNLRTYYKNADGTWQAEGRTYKHRLVITGRMKNAMFNSTFVYLSNVEDITFEQAYRAAGLSSYSGDYFPVEVAVLVESVFDGSAAIGETANGVITDHNGTVLVVESIDKAITEAILEHNDGDRFVNKPDGLIKAESHSMLGVVTKSGTPLAGQTNPMEEITVFVQYVYHRYAHSGGKLEVVAGTGTPAMITFSKAADGSYVCKEFWEPNGGNTYAEEIRSKLPEDIADMLLDPQDDRIDMDALEAQCLEKAQKIDMEELEAKCVTKVQEYVSEFINP